MPIYEYACKNCGQLEVIQGFDEAPLTNCFDCNEADLVKLLSAPAFHLKGNGWYATDFKNPPSARKEEAAATSGPASADNSGANENKTSDKKTADA